MVRRHWQNHVAAEAKAEMLAGPVALAEIAKRAAAENLSIIDYVALLRNRLLALFSAGADAGEKHHCSAIAGRLIELLRFQAKLSGELLDYSKGGTTIVNNVAILNSPQWSQLQAVVLTALTNHPAARRAVIEALRGLEENTAPEAAGTSLRLEASQSDGDTYAVA
jgi:hypothetical protein